MDRYIKIQEMQCLIAKTGDKHARDGEDIQTCSSICADLVTSVCQLPTVDVEEVRHGHWVYEKGDCFPKCSVCGQHHGTFFEHFYCPVCGAKMDDEKKE